MRLRRIAAPPGTAPGKSFKDASAHVGRVAGDVTARCLDLVLATALLVVSAPVVALLAIAIKLDTPGPVLYRGRRVGRGGREFAMLKLRKMWSDAGDAGPLTLRGDARLTRVGAFLVRWKLDELPQLWNVVRGEMSLVGPRPEHPYFVEQRPELFREVLLVAPGITGYAQLAFRRESDLLDARDPIGDYLARVLPRKIALDRLYIARRNVWTNLKVLAWTPLAVFTHRPVEIAGRAYEVGEVGEERS